MKIKMSIPAYLSKIIVPPIFDDKEKTRIASLLHILLMGFIPLVFLTTLALFPVFGSGDIRTYVVSVVAVMSVVIFVISRFGHIQLSSWMFVLVLWGAFSFAFYLLGGVRVPALSIYIVIALIAALLLGHRNGLLITGICITSVIGLYHAENAGYISYIVERVPSKGAVIIQTFALIVTFIMIHLYTRQMNRALAQSQQNEEKLDEINQALKLEMAERLIVEQQLRLAQFSLDSSAHPIFWVDSQANIKYVNEVSTQFLGYSQEELLSKRITDVDPHLSPEMWPGKWEQFRQMGAITFESLGQHSDGTSYPVEINATVREFEGHEYLFAYVTDITERVQVQEALLESETRFRAFMDNNPSPSYIKDDELRHIYANPALLKTTGISLEKLIGSRSSDFFPKEIADQLEIQDRTAMESGQISYLTELPQEQGEKSRWFQDIKFPIQMPDVRIFVGGIAIDISERIWAEDELRQQSDQLEETIAKRTAELTRSNEELEQFAYIASHDLQAPLRKILAFGSRLAEKYQDALDARGQEYLTRMQEAAQRGQRMISDLLELSRVTTGGKPFQRTDLNQVLQDVLSDLEVHMEQEGGQVEVGNLPVIDADPTQMHQLFQNLVGNALKFHKPEIPPSVKVTANADDSDQVQIRVADNGIGFDEEFKERIFQPFQRLHGQSKYEGSGIGLSICRKIVERHGGAIRTESQPGQGASFIITLPIEEGIL